MGPDGFNDERVIRASAPGGSLCLSHSHPINERSAAVSHPSSVISFLLLYPLGPLCRRHPRPLSSRGPLPFFSSWPDNNAREACRFLHFLGRLGGGISGTGTPAPAPAPSPPGLEPPRDDATRTESSSVILIFYLPLCGRRGLYTLHAPFLLPSTRHHKSRRRRVTYPRLRRLLRTRAREPPLFRLDSPATPSTGATTGQGDTEETLCFREHTQCRHRRTHSLTADTTRAREKRPD